MKEQPSQRRRAPVNEIGRVEAAADEVAFPRTEYSAEALLAFIGRLAGEPGLWALLHQHSEPIAIREAAQSLIAAGCSLDFSSSLEMFVKSDARPKWLGVQLKNISEEERRKIAQGFVAAALEIHSGAAVESAISGRSVAKLRSGGHADVVVSVARWLTEDAKTLKKMLPPDFPVEVFTKKPAHHYVPDYYGASFKKLPNFSELPVFGQLASQAIAAGNSLLNFDRLYTLYNALACLAVNDVSEAEFGVVEVGVYKGGTSVFLANVIRALGFARCSLHACDTFSGHAGLDIDGAVDRHLAGHFSDTSVTNVRALLSEFTFANVQVGRIQDTVNNLPEAFGLVHLDTDLYEPTLFGLHYFFDRLVSKGAIVVDDYNSRSCPGIGKAVQEFSAHRSDAFVMPMITGQCLIVPTRSG